MQINGTLDEPLARRLTRDKIKEEAVDLITKRGYHAVTFREIAAAVSTTRANLHYHFGSKDSLIEEVLSDYTKATIQFHREVWTSPHMKFRDKVLAILEFLRERYNRFNSASTEANPWSLSTRLRSDWSDLSPAMRETLNDLQREFERLVGVAVALAVGSGEFRADTPQDYITIQFTNNILYAATFTREMQSFDRLQDLWEATISTNEKAYGAAP